MAKFVLAQTGDNGNAMLQKKVRISKIPTKTFSVPIAMSANLQKTVSNFSKTPKKIIPGPILGQDRPAKIGLRKTQPNVCSKRRDSESNDCAMNSERGASVRGSDPPSGHSVHKTTGDRWWAPASRLIQTYLGAAV